MIASAKDRGGAVERRADKGAAWPNQRADSREERVAVGDVLDDFERQHRVKPLAGGRNLLRRWRMR